MLPDLPEISLLQQRFLEARVLGPLIRAFQREVGAERALEIVGRAIRELAQERGRELAQQSKPRTWTPSLTSPRPGEVRAPSPSRS